MIGKNNITTFQLIFLLIHFQIGVGVITLPYDVYMKAKSDAWISILLTGVIIQLIILLYGALIKRFPSSNLYDIVQILFGRIFGKIFIILYRIYYFSVGSQIGRATRLNSSHVAISYAVFCLKKKIINNQLINYVCVLVSR